MAGRGRGLTLPAWMTSGDLQPVNSFNDNTGSMATVPQKPTFSAPAPTPAAPAGNPTVKPTPPRPPTVSSTQDGGLNGNLPRPGSYSSFNSAVSNTGMIGQGIVGQGANSNFHFATPMMHPSHGFMPFSFQTSAMGGYHPTAGMGMNVMGSFNSGAPAVVPPPAPPLPRQPPGAPLVPIDPNNDISCWAEHESEVGRKYWYNRVSLVSTYDKPFCLKTPEERSIPPCAWKEYISADDKKYYSNGKESTWTMPEEFRVWKEKMDAIEQKKTIATMNKQIADAERSVGGNEAKNSKLTSEAASASLVPSVVYASATEAAEAFSQLLIDMKVSTTAKMREVQDLCLLDPRWDALKSQGEKKQALAEYQTKRLKQEKEAQKVKARRQRDAFLLMLAENTDIDARTRWRDAISILQDDARYKNIEDPRDREELFQEFIVELEKKENEDKRRARDDAVALFGKIIAEFNRDDKINRKSSWGDCKKLFADVMCRADLRSMEESDFRRSFQGFVAQLEEEYRSEQKKLKAEMERAILSAQADLRTVLEELARAGLLTADSRWKDVVDLPAMVQTPAWEQMRRFFPASEDRDGTGLTSACRDVFTKVQNKVYEQQRTDKRLVKDLLAKQGWRVKHDTSFADFKTLILKIARVKVTEDGNTDISTVLLESVPTLRNVEDGEEVDYAPQEQLRAMMTERPFALLQVFNELHKRAVSDFEEELKWKQRVEKKFNSVLADNFYLPDHATISWDDAKKCLQRRSVYDELSKTDRRRLFAEHMALLAAGKQPAAADRAEAGRERQHSARRRSPSASRHGRRSSSRNVKHSSDEHKRQQRRHDEEDRHKGRSSKDVLENDRNRERGSSSYRSGGNFRTESADDERRKRARTVSDASRDLR